MGEAATASDRPLVPYGVTRPLTASQALGHCELTCQRCREQLERGETRPVADIVWRQRARD